MESLTEMMSSLHISTPPPTTESMESLTEMMSSLRISTPPPTTESMESLTEMMSSLHISTPPSSPSPSPSHSLCISTESSVISSPFNSQPVTPTGSENDSIPQFLTKYNNPANPANINCPSAHIYPIVTHHPQLQHHQPPPVPSTSTSPPTPKIISIEGNIGAGKSTLLTHLKNFIYGLSQQYPNIEEKVIFVKEPIHMWEEIADPTTGKSILELFYSNPANYSFAFQTMVIATQEKIIKETLEAHPLCELIISERSAEAGKNVFTEMLVDIGYISAIEYQIYELLFEKYTYKLHMSIYLDIEPNVCFDRVTKRARNGESAMDIEYLKDCDAYYRKWLIEKKELYAYPQDVYIVYDNDLDSILPVIMPLLAEIWG